jgi:hypothetical protein
LRVEDNFVPGGVVDGGSELAALGPVRVVKDVDFSVELGCPLAGG